MSDIKTVTDNQDRVLKRLAAELQEVMVPAMVRDKDEVIPSPVLTVMYSEVGSELNEVIGEYTFLPVSVDDEVQIFSSIVTMTDELPDNNLDELRKAVSRLDFYLPLGSIGMDIEDKRLGFKFGVPIPVTTSEDTLFELINMYITTGYMQVDRYIGMLLKIAQGEAKAEELLGDFED